MKLDIELLKRDMTTFDKYFARLDTTVSKLTEVIEQIHILVSRHDERIEEYRTDSVEIKKLIEDRRREASEAITALEKKVDAQGERISTSITELKTEVLNEISATKASADNSIKKIERWRYIIIGGAMVAAFFINDFIQSETHKAAHLPTPTPIVQTVQPPR